MYTLHLMEVILFYVVLIFGQHSLQANIINNCINSTNSTSCIYTYEQVYNSLAKSENNFYISYALYPGRSKPSSVHVFVNVYALGPNKTKDSTPAMYTWSMSCLYAAVPAVVLEFLSLGSILVTPRTRELNIHIPLFCCNVSENKTRREEIIDERLTRVLAELQDLAVSPRIQDPELNTAECVIHGHQPCIDATGRSSYIRAILWCSFFSVMLLGPIITYFALDFFGNKNKDELCVCCAKQKPDSEVCLKSSCCCNGVVAMWSACKRVVACCKKQDLFMRSAYCVCPMLFLTDICVIAVVICELVHQPGFTFKNIPCEIYISISLVFEGIVICIVRCIMRIVIRIPVVRCIMRKLRACCRDQEAGAERGAGGREEGEGEGLIEPAPIPSSPSPEPENLKWCTWFLFLPCANVISYHFCWLIVGIMINPTWGLTVLAVFCFLSVALFFTVTAICDSDKRSCFKRFCMFATIFVGLCSVASLIVLAGQSFYGKDTADQIVKTTLLYLVAGIIWLFGKDKLSTSSNLNTQALQDLVQTNQAILKHISDCSNQGEPDSKPTQDVSSTSDQYDDETTL